MLSTVFIILIIELFMDISTTQAGVTISDFLFFQQPGVVYTIVISLIAFGAAFWLFGNKFHRMFLTVVFLGGGILAGWYIGPNYGVNTLLALIIGGLLGAGIGYWFFTFWLAIFSSVLIFFILFAVYSWQIAVPYLTSAADDAQQMNKNEIRLAPGSKTPQPAIQKPFGSPSALSEHQPTPVGNAWQELQTLLPQLSRAKYTDWQSWQNNFVPTVQAVWQRLCVIIPKLSLNMLLISGVAFIFGCILAIMCPVCLNIGYTTLLGTILTASGIGILFTLRDTSHFEMLTGQYWIIPAVIGVIWAIGIILQYWMLPPPPPPPEEENGEGDEGEKPKGDKKKK
jgi:hypothetical protein